MVKCSFDYVLSDEFDLDAELVKINEQIRANPRVNVSLATINMQGLKK